MDVAPCEVAPVSVEYLVRGVRIADNDGFVALSAGSVKGPAASAASMQMVLAAAGPRMNNNVTAAGAAAGRQT